MAANWNEVPALVNTLLEPRELGAELQHRIQQAYATLVEKRGTVTQPEDTYAMQRRIARERERFGEYARVFREAEKLLAVLQEEELALAVGEQEGQPNQGLTVPSIDGDIALTIDYSATVYDIDVDQLIHVLCLQMCTYWTNRTGAPVGKGLQDMITEVVRRSIYLYVTLGNFTPQVTKVKAWADTLAREENDSHAAVVRGAITARDRTYKGVSFKRKDPK